MPLTLKLFGHGAGGWGTGDKKLEDRQWRHYLLVYHVFILNFCFDILLTSEDKLEDIEVGRE